VFAQHHAPVALRAAIVDNVVAGGFTEPHQCYLYPVIALR
jgi:hypothetical protein